MNCTQVVETMPAVTTISTTTMPTPTTPIACGVMLPMACRPRSGWISAPAPTLTLPLSPVEAGVYIGALTLPAAGRWLVELRLLQDGAVHYHSTREVVLP